MTEDRVKKWSFSDPRAQRITFRVAEMVALDCQPLSIVEDAGFLRLMNEVEPRYVVPSRKHITDVVLPSVMKGVMAEVEKELSSVQWYSFTTDIWSTEVSNDSLLSFTVHWLTELFERKEAILHAHPLPGSHTGEMLCREYNAMLSKWNIDNEQVHLIVRDNASNMVKAMSDGDFEDLGCFAHTLQLIINDGIFSQRAVTDLIAICRQIVGHFKRSPLAYDRLKSIQDRLQLKQHRLKQDVSTRWNSTLYMLQVILEQKMALAAYATEYEDVRQLTTNQLDLAGKVAKVLGCVEEITKSVSTDAASVSLIIPFIQALRLTLEKNDDSDRGVRTMKADMLASLNRRYADIEKNTILSVATLLDPRFKDKFFSESDTRATAVETINSKLSEMANDDGVSIVPPPKRSKQTKGIWNCFNEIIEKSGACVVGETDNTDIEQYLREPLIQFHRANSYLWWKENKHRFVQLSRLARRYLAPPPTSVASERLFSTAGDIYDEKRNRLAPERAEMLLFIKKNFALVHGK